MMDNRLLLKLAIMGLRANDKLARRLARKLVESSLELSQAMKGFAASANEASTAVATFADAMKGANRK